MNTSKRLQGWRDCRRRKKEGVEQLASEVAEKAALVAQLERERSALQVRAGGRLGVKSSSRITITMHALWAGGTGTRSGQVCGATLSPPLTPPLQARLRVLEHLCATSLSEQDLRCRLTGLSLGAAGGLQPSVDGGASPLHATTPASPAGAPVGRANGLGAPGELQVRRGCTPLLVPGIQQHAGALGWACLLLTGACPGHCMGGWPATLACLPCRPPRSRPPPGHPACHPACICTSRAAAAGSVSAGETRASAPGSRRQRPGHWHGIHQRLRPRAPGDTRRLGHVGLQHATPMC